MFFQVTFKYDTFVESDIVLEEKTLKDAVWYAQHRCEAYGYEGNPKAKVKRISRQAAQTMADNNAINWTNTLD